MAAGNLGAYQLMTTLAKRVGGPAALAVATAVGGYAALRPVEAGVKKVIQRLRTPSTPCLAKGFVFTVTCDGQDGNGLDLHSGAEYRVLECDADAILIEVLGAADNPHFVSAQFLATVSDFPGKASSELD